MAPGPERQLALAPYGVQVTPSSRSLSAAVQHLAGCPRPHEHRRRVTGVGQPHPPTSTSSTRSTRTTTAVAVVRTSRPSMAASSRLSISEGPVSVV